MCYALSLPGWLGRKGVDATANITITMEFIKLCNLHINVLLLC